MKKADAEGQLVETLSLSDLSRFCGVEDALIIDLVEYGVLEPRGEVVAEWSFQAVSISRAKKATRLHRDLGVNSPGIALVLDLLEERDALLRRMAWLDDA